MSTSPLTVEQAAALAKVTPGRIRQLVDRGTISAERFGRQIAVDRKSLQNHILTRKVGRPKKSGN